MRVITKLRVKPAEKDTSLYDLRMTLLNLAEDEQQDAYHRMVAPVPNAALRNYERVQLNIGLARFHRAIGGYSRGTLLAILGVANNPSYSLLDWADDEKENHVRDTAIFFDTTQRMGVTSPSMTKRLEEMYQMLGTTDLTDLHARSVEGTKALFQLSYHVNLRSESIKRNAKMSPELVDMVMERPEYTEQLIEFIERRQLESITDLHPQVFLDVLNAEAQSMRDGVL